MKERRKRRKRRKRSRRRRRRRRGWRSRRKGQPCSCRIRARIAHTGATLSPQRHNVSLSLIKHVFRRLGNSVAADTQFKRSSVEPQKNTPEMLQDVVIFVNFVRYLPFFRHLSNNSL
jgi:hypothetical protein